MKNTMMKMVKGVGIGMAIGCVAGIKKNMGKALRSVGDLVDDVTSFF